MSTNKFFIVFSSIFGISGVAMLVGGVLMYYNTVGFVARAEKAEGKVVEVVRRDTAYVPVVQFLTKEGKRIEHISATGSNPPSFEVGDMVQIFYDSQDPYKAEIDSFSNMWVGVLVLGGLGVVNTGIALGVLWYMQRRKKLKAWLKEHGTLVQAMFMRVEQNTSVNMAGRSPWKVVAVYKDPGSGVEYTYKSEDIWANEPPTVSLNAKLSVYIDPQNPKRHTMEPSW